MIRLVDEIKKEIPADFSSENLERFLSIAEGYANDSEFSVDPTSALEFAGIIDGLLGKYSDQLKSNLEIQKRLRMLSVKVHWLSPGSLESTRKDLISNLILALKMEVDVISTIKRWLDNFEWGVGPDIPRRADFLNYFASNEEFIGAGNIKLPTGETVAPSVSNWIKNYFSSLPVNKIITGGFDKIHYLTNNQNASKLNNADKNILSQIIDIYNFLKNPEESLTGSSISPDQLPSKPAIPTVSKSPVPPVLRKQNIPPRPAPPAPPKQMSDFDRKLAQVTTTPTAPGKDLEVMRKQMVPRQANPSPVRSFDRSPSPARGEEKIDEIKREVNTGELPAHQEPPKPVFKPAAIPPAPKPVAAPVRHFDETPYPSNGEGKLEIQSLDQIRVVDDLKKVEISNLRQGPVDVQTQTLKSKIINIASANKLLPYYTVSAFEESPLFKAYLQIGSEIILDNSPDRASVFKSAAARAGSQMTMQEFEAIADLKKEIEGL